MRLARMSIRLIYKLHLAYVKLSKPRQWGGLERRLPKSFQRVRSDRTWSCKCSSTQPPSLMFLMSSSAALCPVFSAGSPTCRCQSHEIRPITFEVLQVHFKCILLSIAGHFKSKIYPTYYTSCIGQSGL